MQIALLDLLGGTDGPDIDIIKPSSVQSQPMSSSNNQDLLDLLGGLDTIPLQPMSETGLSLILENNNGTINNNQPPNFLTGDILNTNLLNGTLHFI